MFVLTSDNGWLLGEHGVTNRKELAYEAAQSSLWIVGPGFPVGVDSDAFVHNTDVAPTLLQVARATRYAIRLDSSTVSRCRGSCANRRTGMTGSCRCTSRSRRRRTGPARRKGVRTWRYKFVQYADDTEESTTSPLIRTSSTTAAPTPPTPTSEPRCSDSWAPRRSAAATPVAPRHHRSSGADLVRYSSVVTTGSRCGPISKNVVTFSNSKPGVELHGSVREVVEERGERDPGLDARERGAGADVRAVPEREVLIGVDTVEVELVAVLEQPLVAVGRADADDDPLALDDLRLADRGRVRARPGDEQDRRREAQALLDRAGSMPCRRAAAWSRAPGRPGPRAGGCRAAGSWW